MINISQALAAAVQQHKSGDYVSAEETCRRILFLDPQHLQALYMLSVMALEQRQYRASLDYIGRAIAINRLVPEFHNVLGEAYRVLGRIEEARASYRQALVLKPDFAEAHNNLGTVARDVTETEACYRRALAIRPDYPEAHYNLGNVLRIKGSLQDAMASYERALTLKPDFVDAHHNLGNTFMDQGRVEDAMASFQRALALKPDNDRVHSALLFSMSYRDVAPDAVAQGFRKWNEQHARSLEGRKKPHLNNRDANRRLRVGYVSGDFREHPICYFIEPLLSAHDHTHVEVVCYSTDPWVDATTQRVQKYADAWRSLVGVKDEDAADLIANDRIDILIDLAGHTGGNRLLVFARKPAPVQVTYLGSLTTTGLTAIDYRLTDRFLTPPDTAEWFAEELVRLPGCFLCYRQPAEVPAVSPLPAAQAGHVTFGSCNNFTKVTPAVVELWSRILLHVPRSRLVLKDRNFADAAHRLGCLELFGRCGIEEDRIELLARTSIYDYFALYGRVDIGLDPFPYNGCTTTCDTLWMGVPVVTLAGVMSYSRFGVSLLSNLGLEELIATTPDAYVEKAVGLAKDLTRLAALRETLRQRMAGSPLCDAKAFAQGVERAYRDMWKRWCGGRS
nr:tetratricopeptide repeat protein [Nitrospirota bacterium]